jgi:hypothetical protein
VVAALKGRRVLVAMIGGEQNGVERGGKGDGYWLR